MTITLPLENQRWPRFRLLTTARWGGTTTSDGGWKIEAMERPGIRASGFILVNYTRSLLPQLGTAEIVFRFGMFSGIPKGASAESLARMRAGQNWTPGTDKLALPDLKDKEIRIQVAYPDANGDVDDGSWRTVWWGTCEYQIDKGWGGAGVPSGERTYHCLDAFARTKRWFLDRHGFKNASRTIAPAAGHPGYNVSRGGGPAQLAGNKDSTSASWSAVGEVAGALFCLPGSGNSWTDIDAVNEALTNHRPSGEPHWVPGGATDLFNTYSPWPVQEGDTVFDLVARVFNRARGRGVVLPDFSESSPTGPLTCLLTVFAQVYQNIAYDDPAASQVTINGAAQRGTAVDVELIGDHRLVPGSLELGDAQQYRVDYLVSQGEQIEVCGTLEHGITLEEGWSDAEQTAFLALDADKRISERWRPLYQLHRLKRTFNMELSNGNSSGISSADYRCTDAGQITTARADDAIGDTAPSMVEILDDLPLYDGYKYDTQPPTREDGQSAVAFNGTPARREPMVMFRDGEEDRFIRVDSLSYGVQFKIMPDGFMLLCADDQATGLRKLGDDDSSLQQDRRFDSAVFTVGFRLPHRVRMASGKPNGARRMVITHRDIHLWLSHPSAIWKLDDTNSDNAPAYPPKRIGGSSYSIIRDDRSALARLHALAAAWYLPTRNSSGQEQFKHRNASWSLRCCGDIPSSTAYDGGGVVYPTLGKVVHLLKANGEHIECNSVVSSISYDNTNGTTTWTTDWMDLDVHHG